MNKVSVFSLSALMIMGAAVASHAQVNTTEGGNVPGHGRVNAVDRGQRHQSASIAEGVKTGQLTEAEAADLKRKENAIQAEKTRDMMKHHGHLTKGQKRHLRKEQAKLDRDIKRERSDAETQKPQ